MNRTFTTEKGTVLPVLNLRGQDYLEVKYRLVWFREEHPGWSIETEFVSLTDRSACARAIVREESGRIIATAHKAETAAGFQDFLEKAETGAIGRALALIGFGTQFCADELDEGERIVDSPAVPVRRALDEQQRAFDESRLPAPASGRTVEPDPASEDLGEYEVTFGRKYLGMKLKDIPKRDIEGYLAWMNKETIKKGGAPSFEVRALEKAAQWYHYPETRPQTAPESTAAGDENEAAEETLMPGLSTVDVDAGAGRSRKGGRQGGKVS